jgi:hypothetical protein
MEEKRQRQRQRILKAGTIAFARAAGITCMVRNISDTGACLEVETPIGIPDEFILVVKDLPQQTCHVAWRSARRIGVRFQKRADAYRF